MKTWLALAVLLYSVPVRADTHAAVDCTADEIQTAITAAQNHASAWEKVTIPGPCDETHTTQITVAVPSGTVFWIAGAGVTTELSDNLTKDGDNGDPWMAVSGVNSTNMFRLSDFQFTGLTGSNNNRGHIEISATSGDETPNVRIDHITVNPSGDPFVMWGGCPYALMDNITFTSTTQGDTVTTPYHQACGGGAYGDGSWNMAVEPGSWNAIYIQDSTITQVHTGSTAFYVIDQFRGSRVVIRDNTFNESTITSHGTDEGQRERGMMWLEAYGNLFDCNPDELGDPQWIDSHFNWRGGSGIAVNNETKDCSSAFAWNDFVKFNENRSAGSSGNVPFGGACDGDAPFDENNGGMGEEGYRCIDQHGSSTGDLLSGETPSPTGWPNQEFRPIYVTGNNLNGNPSGGMFAVSGAVGSDRDYYGQLAFDGIQTSSSSPFDGTTGAGYGTTANRPSTCTTGVGYYDTQLDRLDKCTATNTWTLYWSNPGTHPLTNEAVWAEPASSVHQAPRLRLRVR